MIQSRTDYELQKPYMAKAVEHLYARVTGDAHLASKWANSPAEDPFSIESIRADMKEFLVTLGGDGSRVEQSLQRWMDALTQSIDAIAASSPDPSKKAELADRLVIEFLERLP